jgi:hypothetical protein
MRIILFLCLLLPQVTLAQKSLGRETFMVNIRPTLNGILGDFYQMIVLFPDFPRELIPLVQELDTLTNDKETLRETCPRLIEKSCKGTLESLKLKLAKIRSLSLDLLTQQRMSSSLYINSLAGFRLVTQFDSEMEEIKGYIDNASFLLTAQIPQKRETYALLKDLDELNTLISLALVEFIPFTYRDDFRHFYTNFVQPIQIQISKNKNYEFLNRNVNSLNFALNLLNMNLTKRNKKTPDGMAPFLAVLHNRWNSILRFYY